MLTLALLASLAAAAGAAPAVRLAYFYKPPADATPAAFLAVHFQIIILTHADEPYMAELRRVGYRGPVLQYIAANETEGPGPYANASAACDRSYPAYARTVADRDGVFCRDVHPHEAWFLHNLRGERLWTRYQSANGVWRTTYLMNPGNASWRRFLIRRLQQYRQLGFDGFFLDNVDLSRDGLLLQPTSRGGVAEFATDGAYRDAEVGYLAALRAAFPKIPLWANLTHDPQAPGGWNAYLDDLDGVMVEDFALGWQTSPLSAAGREIQLDNARAALQRGKGVIAVEQGAAAANAANRARLQFGLACYWALAPQAAPAATAPTVPRGLYFRYGDAFNEDYRTVTWHPEYDFQPGAPLSNLAIQDATWSRLYAAGELRLDLARGQATLPPSWRRAWDAR